MLLVGNYVIVNTCHFQVYEIDSCTKTENIPAI